MLQLVLLALLGFSVREVGKIPDGPTWTVVKKDSVVFLGSGASFFVVNVAHPENPKILKKVELNGAVTTMLLDGHWLFVGEDLIGIDVFDISDPTSPRLVFFERIDGLVYRLNKFDDWLFVSQREYGLRIYKFEDGKLQLVETYDDLHGEVTKAVLFDNRLFVGLGDSGLAIYKFGRNGELKGLLCRKLFEESVEDFLLVGGDTLLVALWNGRILSLDVSPSRCPRELFQSYVSADEPDHFASIEYDSSSSTLFAIGYDPVISYGKIDIFDVSVRSMPLAIGSISFKINKNYVHEAVADGGILYLAADFKGLLIGKWTRIGKDSVEFNVLSNVPVSLSYITALDVADTILAAADAFGKFALFNVSDVSNPVLFAKGGGGVLKSEYFVDTFPVLDIRSLKLVGRYLYAGLMEQNAFGVLDIENPSEQLDIVPVPLEMYEMPSNFYQILPVSDSFLIVAKDFNGVGLASIEISPDKPKEIKSKQLDGYIECVALAKNGKFILAGDLFGRIFSLNIKDFEIRDTLRLKDWVRAMAMVNDSLLYVANKSEGVEIIKLLDDGRFICLGSLPLDSSRLAVSLSVFGNLVAVGAVDTGFNKGWVEFFDISEPAHPQKLGEVFIPGYVKSAVFDKRGHLFVSGFLCGVKIFEVQLPGRKP